MKEINGILIGQPNEFTGLNAEGNFIPGKIHYLRNGKVIPINPDAGTPYLSKFTLIEMSERHVQHLAIGRFVPGQRQQVGDMGPQGNPALARGIGSHVELDGIATEVGNGLGGLHQQRVGGEFVKAGEGLGADADVIRVHRGVGQGRRPQPGNAEQRQAERKPPSPSSLHEPPYENGRHQ